MTAGCLPRLAARPHRDAPVSRDRCGAHTDQEHRKRVIAELGGGYREPDEVDVSARPAVEVRAQRADGQERTVTVIDGDGAVLAQA